MAESGMRASASISARSRLLSERVKRLLARVRLSRRDDADFFFATFFLHRMNDQQQNHTSRESDGVPAFLALNNAVDV